MSLNTTAATFGNDTSFSQFEATLPKKIIQVLMYCILLVVSFTGNLLIVGATSRDNRLRSTTNILIANMAVSDLVFSLLSVPKHIAFILYYQGIWLIDGDFGLVLCKLVYFLPDVSLGVSIYSCVFIALDRFYAVVYPLRGSLSKRKLKYIIPGIWMFSMMLFTNYFFSAMLVKTGESTKCVQQMTKMGIRTNLDLTIYIFTMFALSIGVPLPIISFLYLRIALALRRTIVPGQAGNTSSVRERQNKNALKMSAVVVSLFFLSWLPLTIYSFLIHFRLVNLSRAAWEDLFFSVVFIAQSRLLL